MAVANNIALQHPATMLILDVRTHGPLPTRCYIRLLPIQMLSHKTNVVVVVVTVGQAMDYCTVVDDFVAKNQEM